MFRPGSTVYLTVDLTQYHPSLKRGAKGVQLDAYASIGDRFTTVQFPETTLPILFQSLSLNAPSTDGRTARLREIIQETEQLLADARSGTGDPEFQNRRIADYTERLERYRAYLANSTQE